MPLVHAFDAGERVWIYQMHPSKGLLCEGRATIVARADADEYYTVLFDNDRQDGETYQRFVDRDGQEDPAKYIAEFNEKIGFRQTCKIKIAQS